MNMDLVPRQFLLVDFYWGAKGTPWQREALPDAEGGAKRCPPRTVRKALSAEGAIGELARHV